jgi:hypothetical protein
VWIKDIHLDFYGIRYCIRNTGYSFSLSLYGFATTDPLSLVGVFIVTLFLLKGLAAVSLWLEQDWAVDFAIVDAWIGIVACVFAMFVHPFHR